MKGVVAAALASAVISVCFLGNAAVRSRASQLAWKVVLITLMLAFVAAYIYGEIFY